MCGGVYSQSKVKVTEWRGPHNCIHNRMESLDEALGAREGLGSSPCSGVSSSCGARGGFLPRHDEDLCGRDW